jgi:prephenate dehydratase
MKKVEELKMVLVAIHDRPLKTELGHYVYVIECAGSSYADYQKWQQISAPYEIVVEDTLFESDVCILGYVPEEDTKRLAHDVVNVTAARAFLTEKDGCFASVPIS